MSTAEIIAELPRLNSAELVQVLDKVTALVGARRTAPEPISTHAALGIWKDRVDLPDDATDASVLLRQRMMRRTDEVLTDDARP